MNPTTVMPAEIVDLGLAIGLLRKSSTEVEFDSDWFSNPGPKVSKALADDDRRNALVRFVDAVNGESTVITTNGIKMLKIFDATELGLDDAPPVTVMLAIDERNATYVEVGLAVSFSTTSPTTRTDLIVPLYRTGKLAADATTILPVSEHFSLAAGSPIRVSTSITLGGSPDPSGFHLDGVDVTAAIRVDGHGDPAIELTLRGLRLPGATTPTDIHIGGPGSTIEDSLLSLVLGVVRASANALGNAGAVVMAALDLIGLGPNPQLLPLDVNDVLDRGVSALQSWFSATMASGTARTAWLASLGTVMGGTVVAEVLRVPIGSGLSITLAVDAKPGAGGHLKVTPKLGVELTTTVGAGPSAVVLAARADIDVMTIDLADGSLTPVPAAQIYVDAAGNGVRLLSSGPVLIGAVHLGVGLINGRVEPVIRLLNVAVGAGPPHPVIDLSSGDAAVAAIGQVAGDLLGSILDGFPAGAHLKALLGLVPTGAMPALDGGQMLVDPLAALRNWWHQLLTAHSSDVPALLAHVRDLVAHDSKVALNGNPAAPVSGLGTAISPWSIPVIGRVSIDLWMDGQQLVVAVRLGFRVDDLAGGCTVVEAHARAELLAVDFATAHASLLRAADLTVALRGRGLPQARLGLGPVAVVADSLGIVGRWTAHDGLGVHFAAPGLAIEVGETTVALALPTTGDWRTSALDDVERLIAVLGLSHPTGWLNDLIELLGWSLTNDSHPHRLSLAALAIDAPAALKSWATTLITDADVIARATSALARLLTGSTAGLAGAFSGAGTIDNPWLIALGSDAQSPSFSLALGPFGPVADASTTSTALQSWRPGLAGLPPEGLGQSVLNEALAGVDMARLASGRGRLGSGLADLLLRSVDTDGLVTSPPTPMDGVTVRIDRRRTTKEWATMTAAEALDSAIPANAAVLHVAIGTLDRHPWKDAVPADRIVDLTPVGLAPESFTVPSPDGGDWYAVLASRTNTALGVGDPSGVAGQAARLSRVVAALGVGRPVVLIALSGAGHAARLAADSNAAVTDLITLGTPWSPIAFDTLRNGDSGDAVRLLKALLVPVDLAEPDDDDLALGRALVDCWLDTGTQLELEAPRPTIAPRVGLRAQAVFGSLDRARIERALTAIVASGLSQRAMARNVQASAQPTSAQLSLHLPIPTGGQPSGHGIEVSGSIDIGLAGSAFDVGHASVSPRVRINLSIAETGGWLIGGPGSVPVNGGIPVEVRMVDVSIDVGFGVGATSTAEVVLHEVSALGAWRDRVVVRPNAVVSGTNEDLPFLPEARVVLAAVFNRLRTVDPTSPAASVIALFDGIGLSTTAGLIPDALSHLLHDPKTFVTSAISTNTARLAIGTALSALVPGAVRTADSITITSGPAVIGVNLAQRRISLQASSSTGVLPWQISVTELGSLNPTGSITVGAASPNSAAVRINSSPCSAELLLPTAAAASQSIALWPAPDTDGVMTFLESALPAEATRLVLSGIRGLDPTVAAGVDALAAALGILAAADPSGYRAIVAPLALFRDPGAWLRTHALTAGGSVLNTDAVIDLFEAVKPFIGLAGTARGQWPIVDGVTLAVAAGAGGTAIGCVLDPSRWLGSPGRVPCSVGVSLGLTVPTSGAPRPNVELFVGVPEPTPTAAHRRAVHVLLDGTALRVLLRPSATADIEIYPNAAGLGALLGGVTDMLLPLALNALAAMTGDPTRQQIAALVTAMGKGLGLIDLPITNPAHFNDTKVRDLTNDPGLYLAAHAPTLIGEVVVALNPLLGRLPGAVTASLVGQDLQLTVHGVVATISPNPIRVSVSGQVGGLAELGSASASFSADAGGLQAWQFGIGPASFDLGGPKLRPLLRGGRNLGGDWDISLGLSLDDLGIAVDGHKELLARWRDSDGLAIVARTRKLGVDHEDTAAGPVALFAADAVLELIGNFIVGQTDVDAMLNRSVGASTVRKVLQGSILSTTNDHAMAAAPVSSLPGSLFVLARNLTDALPPLDLDVIKLSLHRDGDIIGLRVDVAKPDEGIILNQGADIQISLVTDARWIEPPTGTSPDPGIIIEFVAITAGPHPTISVHPSIAANGIGVKIAKGSGPLLDAGLRLEAVKVHLFGKLEPITGGVGVSGGVHLELAGLGVPLGPGGGDNSVAKGVLSDAGGSGAPPTPKFSPALAIQSHHGGNGVAVSLAGGPGDGPWYLPIQRAFGPVYLEQIGLRTTYNSTTPRKLQTISVSLDGTVSLFGISASVDKLRLTYAVNSDFFKASSWSVDLDGFAISSSIGGLTLVGALIRAELAAPLKGVDYLGMLKIGFNGYGVDLFGGYANPVDSTGSFASFFAFGALHAPLGGPPAFFITGIGIGFGINRELKPPTMETITSNPFLVAMKALGAPPNPKTQLEQMRANIAPKRGEYWVAAGISFTSFVLISGEVVVTVAFGDGLEITLLGLARAELPAPGLTLVSIELALLVRFSTKEGTILVQAQLTENSWLLTESVRLTGGFAMQAWWKGPNAGQFVVTMGGYHPKFHKAGYPVVPRLGFRWQPIDNVSIIGESYFALCSEALMAGTSFEANAHFGPAHARVSFGADGIVFFDPFWFEISAWAEISAGIKIWLLFGTVTIELSLGAKLTVSGPPIFVEGVFEICGFEVPFEFGERTNPADKALSAVEFRDKYLRAKSDAQVLQSSVVRGAVPGGRQGNGSPQKVPDGSPGNPFRVVPEFELMFITTAPAVVMNLLHKDDTTKSITTTVGDLGVAPMNSPSLDSTFQVEISKFVEPKQFEIARIKMLQRPPASFPKGVWGEAQDKNKKSVPEGKTIDAADGFTISTVLDDPAGAPAIDYHQVEIRLDHKRKPLPFVTNTANANARRATTQKMRDLTEALRPASANLNARFNIAARLLDAGGYGTLGVAALRGERNAPPLFGSLADDLVKTPAPMSPAINPTIVDHSTAQFVTRGPTVTSVLSSSMTTALPRQATTTVQNPGRAIPRLTPSLDGMRAAINRIAPASLLIREPSAVLSGRRSVAVSGSTPLTRLATSASAAVANAHPTPAGQQQLALMTRELAGGGDGAMVIRDGELVVVAMGTRPTGDGRHQVTVVGGPCRVIALAAGGNVLFDDVFDSQNQETPGRIDVPLKTDRLVLVGNGSLAAVGGALDGWYNGQSLPLLGWDMALSARSIVRFASNKLVDNRERSNGGWANTRQLSRAASITTRFDRPITALAIAIDDSYLDGRRDAASSIDMRLVGAIRSMDRDGQVVPPTVLVQGIRSILVYSIEPQRDDSARDPNVLVIIDNARNGQVSGVVGDISTVDAMVTALSDAGFDAAVGAAIPGGAGTRSVSWTTAGGQ